MRPRMKRWEGSWQQPRVPRCLVPQGSAKACARHWDEVVETGAQALTSCVGSQSRSPSRLMAAYPKARLLRPNWEPSRLHRPFSPRIITQFQSGGQQAWDLTICSHRKQRFSWRQHILLPQDLLFLLL